MTSKYEVKTFRDEIRSMTLVVLQSSYGHIQVEVRDEEFSKVPSKRQYFIAMIQHLMAAWEENFSVKLQLKDHGEGTALEVSELDSVIEGEVVDRKEIEGAKDNATTPSDATIYTNLDCR